MPATFSRSRKLLVFVLRAERDSESGVCQRRSPEARRNEGTAHGRTAFGESAVPTIKRHHLTNKFSGPRSRSAATPC
jgi:hypothetical protein